jgi:hypothetical protein
MSNDKWMFMFIESQSISGNWEVENLANGKFKVGWIFFFFEKPKMADRFFFINFKIYFFIIWWTFVEKKTKKYSY